MRSDNIFGTVVVVIIGACALLALWLARTMGAAFTPTFTAVAETIVGLGIAYLLIAHVFDGNYWEAIVAGTLAFTWFGWWKVLDSIACGGCSDTDQYPDFMLHSFVNSIWVKGGVEVMLLAVTGYVLFRRSRYNW